MKANILAVAALVASSSVFAQGYHGQPPPPPPPPHARVDFYFGMPYPWYVPPPVYYYPPAVVYQPPVVVREAPTVYIEQDAAASQPKQTFEAGYWYYCADRKGYYPTVSSCPGAWQKVAPTNQPSN